MALGRQRRKILAASLMPAAIIGIPLALLLISEMRALGRLEQATRQVLTQTGVSVAEALARELRRELATGHRTRLDAIPRDAIESGDLPRIRQAVAASGSAEAAGGTFFYGTVDPDGEVEVLFDAPDLVRDVVPAALGWRSPNGSAAAARAGFRPIPGLGDAIGERLRTVETTGVTNGCGFFAFDGRQYLLLLRLAYGDTVPPRAARFTGYVLDTEEMTRRYLPPLGTRLRSSEWSFSTDQPLEISVIDDRGNEAFRTGPSLRSGYVHEAPFPLLLLGDDHLMNDPDHLGTVPIWLVRSGYPGTDPAALARSLTNQQRQVLFLVGLVAAVGIFLSGRASARELGLAGMKAEFVSSVSHDLKTPVASIQVLADVLMTAATLPPEKVQGYGRVIGNEARRLGKLVDGMLESERINTGGRMYNVESIDLRAPVREALGEFAAQLKERAFRTELRLPSTVVSFVGNAEALSHAFANVVGNAIKYSGDDRFLRVEMFVSNSNAVIAIHDRGFGIPAAERAKIFDRFYRVRRDSETDPAGTGLGLPIAQHVVRAHGGRISVGGHIGGGSVFTIELPLDRQQSALVEDPEA